MSRAYTHINLTGRIDFDEDFASRATQGRGVPIDLDEPITAQDDSLLLALLARQRAREEERLLRHYAEAQSMLTFAF